MTIKDIFQIIESNVTKHVDILSKDIVFNFSIDRDLVINNSYELISVINNLIINGVEAINTKGEINVQAAINNEQLEIMVKDNGVGIAPEDRDVIFEPGFTTKFDDKSGKMNAGIGLTHVMHIVKSRLSGEIDLNSNSGMETIFTVRIPISNI
jgi:two-component system sensor histidine kinase YcbA